MLYIQIGLLLVKGTLQQQQQQHSHHTLET